MEGGGQWEEDMELRKGPWTIEEDLLLVNYISNHGEGRWNSLARSAGLRRTGKSCRLRWLNYLRPDLRRGNITPEEQLLILELHSRWGNRWSKIAQHLPGRTDNEIKNYWRTRVQKQAKQLKCDVNSKKFKDAMKYLWMPRLVERIRAAADVKGSGGGATAGLPTEDLSTETECSSAAGGGDKSEDFASEEMMMMMEGGDGFFSETLTSPISGGFDEEFMGLEEISLVGVGEDYFQSGSLWNCDDYWFFQ